MDHFGEGAGVVEVGAGRFSGLTGANPVFVGALVRDALDGGIGHLVVLHVVAQDEAGISAIFAGGEDALVADEEGAVFATVAQDHIFGHACGACGAVVDFFSGLFVFPVSIVPEDVDRAHISPGWEGVFDGGGDGEGLGVAAFLGDHFDTEAWCFNEFQGPVGGVHDVAGHVAEGTGAEVGPCTPIVGGESFVVGAPRGGADPAVPIDAFRGGHGGEGFGHALVGPDGAGGPHVDFFDLTDGTGGDHFAQVAHAVAAVALVAHLGHDTGFFGGVLEQSGFGDGVGEGFLDVDMFSEFHRHVGGGCVGVVGGGDGDCVNFGHALEHVSVVVEALRVGHVARRLGGTVPIHIAKGDNVLAEIKTGANVAGALATRTDGRDIEFFVGGFFPRNDLRGVGFVLRGGTEHGRGRGDGQERPPRYSGRFHDASYS